MIIITDTSSFSVLQLVESSSRIIPNALEIQSLIGNSEFINLEITTAFKNLLINISNACLTPILPLSISQNLLNRASQTFNTIGFNKTTAGNISFQLSIGGLDAGTSMIINSLHDIIKFKDIAYNAFHNNSWAKVANDIRGMAGSGLRKHHFISVFNNSNVIGNQNRENESNLLNNKDQSTDRFLKIKLDNNAEPVMPDIRIYNNSDVNIHFRLMVEHKNFVTNSNDDSGGFGPAEPYDLNNNGTILPTENVYLNRRFIDFFPNLVNSHNTTTDKYTRSIAPQQHWDVNFDTRIRGGEVTIEFLAGLPRTTPWINDNLNYFKFYIRGQNPTYSQVKAYLNSQNYLTRFWFLIRKIRHESRSFGSFNFLTETHDSFEFQHFNRLKSGENYSIRKNIKTGLPNFGPPRGFGLGQVDNLGSATQAQVPTPPAIGDTIIVEIDGNDRAIDFARKIVAADQDVWSWKNNLNTAINFIIDEKIPATVNKIIVIRTAVVNWNTKHPNDLVIVPAPINYDTIQYAWVASAITEFIPYNDLFQQGNPPVFPVPGARVVKSFFDAMLLKAYNGNSGGGFFMDLATQSGKPAIVFHVTNNLDFNYVEKLSNRDD